jgi:hypothetical protein
MGMHIVVSTIHILWGYSDFVGIVFRRTILSVKTRARSQRTCCQHAMVVVSSLLCSVLRLQDLSSHLFRSVFYPTAYPGEEVRRCLRGRLVRVQLRNIFPH